MSQTVKLFTKKLCNFGLLEKVRAMQSFGNYSHIIFNIITVAILIEIHSLSVYISLVFNATFDCINTIFIKHALPIEQPIDQ